MWSTIHPFGEYDLRLGDPKCRASPLTNIPGTGAMVFHDFVSIDHHPNHRQMSIQSPLEGMMTLEMGLEDISLGTKDDEEQVEDDDDASSSTSTSTIRAGDSIDHEPVPATKAGPSDELERFRREWKREMETKKDVGGVNVGPVRWKRDDPSSSAAPATTSSSKNMTGPSRRGAPLSPDVPWRALPQDLDGPPQEVQPQPQPRPLDSLPPVRPPGGRRKGLLVGKEREDAAVQMYARAVENEQAGQLNDALMLYRQAFKLNGECRIIILPIESLLIIRKIMLTGSTLDLRPSRLEQKRTRPRNRPISCPLQRRRTSRTLSRDTSRWLQITILPRHLSPHPAIHPYPLPN